MAGEPLAEQSGGFDKGRWPVRLCLPGNDFWLFDKKLIRFSYFSGDGHILEDEMVSDRAVARMWPSHRPPAFSAPGSSSPSDFALLVEESVLRHRLGRSGVMTTQLGHLLEAKEMPSMSLGVIPFTAGPRPMWPLVRWPHAFTGC
jgi:hypothetical protein